MRRLIEEVYGRMPREFASPQRRIVHSTDRLIEIVDEHNGLTDCFVSAYGFATDECSYSDVVINKAVFDFDGDWDHLVRAHEWLEERGAAHFVVFSGSDESGHLYVLTEPTRHQQSLEYFQRNIVVGGVGLRKCTECGTEVSLDASGDSNRWHCGSCDDDLVKNETTLATDDNLIGDPATMIRIPNTWNPGAERFCIPLRPEEVTMDTEAVHGLAREQRDLTLSDIVCGERPVKITQRRAEAEEQYQPHSEKQGLTGFEVDGEHIGEFSVEIQPHEIMDNLECECVRSMITDDQDRRAMPPLGHTDRRVLITHLVERGYNPAEIHEFLRFTIEDEKARHCIVEEKQPMRLWKNGVRAPNKISLKRAGLLSMDCPVHTGRPTE